MIVLRRIGIQPAAPVGQQASRPLPCAVSVHAAPLPQPAVRRGAIQPELRRSRVRDDLHSASVALRSRPETEPVLQQSAHVEPRSAPVEPPAAPAETRLFSLRPLTR